ncbi:MAG: DUF4349 domain-containing protein [Armatimonadota bacterium]|jgi:hypothetical protein
MRRTHPAACAVPTLLAACAILATISGCGLMADRGVEAPADYYAGDAVPMEEPPPQMEQRSMDLGAAMDEAMSPTAPVGMTAAEAAPVDRKVIKSGEVSVEITDIEAAQKQIIEMVDRSGGFVQSMTVSDYDTSRQAEIIARIPSDHFSEIYDGVRGLGKVTRDHIGGQDVTQEYMDLERRIANLQAQEERVREMFEDAESVEDLLKIEQRLTEVRGQIEQYQGRLRFLKDQVGYSTLTISLYEPGMAPIEQPDGWRIGYHLRGAWLALVGAFRSLVYGVIWIVIAGSVVWVPLAVVILLIRRWALRRRAEREREQ